MRRIAKRLALVAIFSTGLAGCSPPSSGRVAQSALARERHPQVSQASESALVKGNNEFGVDLFHSVRDKSGNLVFSPFSISSALAMTYAGARADTEQQMAGALHFDLPRAELHPAFNALDLALAGSGKAASPDTQPLQLEIANSIWAEQTLRLQQDYLDLIARNYGAGVRLADFIRNFDPARREINAWVSNQTHGRIEDLLAQGTLDASTRMVLVNAIYFKGDWQEPFDANDTSDALFYRLDGSSVPVRMMHAHISGAAYAAGDGYQAVELAYQGGTSAMDIIVPDQGQFQSFEGGLDATQLSMILAALQPGSLQLGLPKFHFNTTVDLGERLAALGMPDAFDPDRADFSGITGARDLFIDKVLHQAAVAVDEKGTEAAAATAVIMGPTSAMQPDLSLVVDRPFIFLIRDLGTQQILFLGRVLDPSQ